MKLNRKWFLVIALVLSLTMATAGTLAYLTDRDSEANVFTVGNVKIDLKEDFQQGATLIPGVNIDKKPVVENIGNNDAWVWAEIAIPSELNSTATASKNVIHFNMTAESVADGKWNWWDGEDYSEGKYFIRNEKIGEIEYDVYVVQYETALKPDDVTEEVIYKVYLDPHVDIDTDGNWAWVEGGVVTPINWNSKTNGDPVIYVSAYAMQTEGFTTVYDAYDAYQTQWGNNGTEWGDPNAALADTWDGTADTSWYNDTDTEFVIITAEQLAGFADLVDGGKTFAGKTVKLGKNIDLYKEDENGNRVSFEPIGDASNADFSGTFDGNGKTISNLYQDCNSKHLGLFGAVYEGAVKNLTLDNARVENDGTGYAGGIASYAGASNFENITLKNSTIVNYNHNTGGIVAWCSNNGTTTTFDGINIESTTTIGSWWGSYDTRVGGIVGAMNTGNYVVIKNSTVACKLDVYNDVMSNYQWWNYRTAGMVVADVRDNRTVDGRTEANPARVTCENVTVIFGDWANYHYCESESYGTPSYASEGEYKFNRVEPGLGYGGVDTSACNHDADETHNELIAFNFLFGARDGKGIYGISEFDGVTVKQSN